MRTPYQRALVGSAIAVVFALTACSGAQNGVGPSAPTSGSSALASNPSISGHLTHLQPFSQRRSHAASMRFDAKKKKSALIYVANFSSNNVTVYDPKTNDPSPIEAISDGVLEPSGDCLDKKGTLYVVNEASSIPEYKRGQTTPFQTITQGLDSPGFCAIDGSGNLWVTNLYGVNVTE